MSNPYTLVLGLGKSGISAAKLLLRGGSKVCLFDANPKIDKEALFSAIGEELPLYTEKLPRDIDISRAVISPGIPLDEPYVEELRQREISVEGEVSLAYEYEKGSLVAITGTNGKTTTTALTGEILKKAFGEDRVFVVGNIGIPYTETADKTRPDTYTVLEVSSFQLETVKTFRPKVSAILNITPDHLNRHKTMELYQAAKERIFEEAEKEDILVLNASDERLLGTAKRFPGKVLYFTSDKPLPEGSEGIEITKDGRLLLHMDGREEGLISMKDVRLVGTCNAENIAASSLLALSLGVSLESLRESLRSFAPVEHRIEYIRTLNGVKYYNDSKATNPDAAIQGIRAMQGPTILIGGGYDKGSSYDEWLEEARPKVKALLLIGQTAPAIAEAAERVGIQRTECLGSLEEAFLRARSLAEEGDEVLLSPACASWGMFRNYEERGREFKALVCHEE